MAEKKRSTVIMENYRKARTKRQGKDQIWQTLDAFDRNEQWTINDTAPWLPKPVTNFIHLVKYTKRAAISTDNPTGKLRATTPQGVEAVQKLNKAYEDTFQRIKARKVVRQNIETSKLLGTAIAHVYWNEQAEGRMGTTVFGDEGFLYEGEIGIREIDPASFYPDPSAFKLEDCGYIVIPERKSLEWAKKKFGDKVKTNEDGESSPDERGEIYLGRDYTTEQQDGKVDFISYYEKKANDEGGYLYTVEYLVNGKVVQDKKPLRPNRYPFAILYDFPQRQDFWGMSTCQFILDNQKIINKVESIIAMIGTLMQNPQKLLSKTSGIDPNQMKRLGMVPGIAWTTNDPDPSKSVYYVQPPQIPMALFNLLENAKSNIREITGITEAYSGQNVGSLQTSSGVQALIDRATMRDRDQMYDVELYIEELSKLIIDFMTTYYEEPRQIRIMGDKPDEYKFEEFLGTAYRDLEYDMFIDVSAKAPITRMREQQEAKELLNMQGQFNFPVPVIKPQEAIQMMNMTHGDKIIERMNMDEMRNKMDEAMKVANMMHEAMMSNVPPEEIQQMAQSMFQQMDQNPGAGNVAAGPGGPSPTDPNVPMA